MVPHVQVASFAVRAPRNGLVVGLALVVAVGSSGCGHRRAAMRPVFAGPVSASPVSASPVTAVPDASCPTGSTMTTTPSSSEPFLTPSNVPPSTGEAGSGVIRAGGGSPPVPDAADEPQLSPPTSNRSDPSATSGQATPSTRPSSSKSSSRQSTGLTKRVRLTLRDQVKPRRLVRTPQGRPPLEIRCPSP